MVRARWKRINKANLNFQKINHFSKNLGTWGRITIFGQNGRNEESNERLISKKDICLSR